MKKIILAIASVLFLIGCATVKTATNTPSQADIDRVKIKFPNYTLAELNQGNVLYSEKCTSCHGLKSPANWTEEQWNKIVPDMTRKANRNEMKISPQEQELILKYLVTMSTAPSTK